MRNNWTYEQTLAALRLYCLLPYGRSDQSTPEVIELASYIGRTPDAVAMKLKNLASLDPFHQSRQVKGLQNASHLDKEVFARFQENPTEMALQSAIAAQKLAGVAVYLDPIEVKDVVSGQTEGLRTVPVRLVQDFFRRVVLRSYGNRCAVCGLDTAEVLNASHIIPWRDDASRRADPRNGLALCALHDRLFDRGLLGIKTNYKIILSSSFQSSSKGEFFRAAIAPYEGRTIHLPARFSPDVEALEFHEQHIFQL